ncbi:MAG: exopolyphosphatase, partial [Microbacteriaceae bacterium]
QLSSYDSNAISGARIPLNQVLDACDSLSKMSKAELTALPYMHPARVDVMAAGSVIWASVLDRVSTAVKAQGRSLEYVTTSEHDILDGAALSLAS